MESGYSGQGRDEKQHGKTHGIYYMIYISESAGTVQQKEWALMEP